MGSFNDLWVIVPACIAFVNYVGYIVFMEKTVYVSPLVRAIVITVVVALGVHLVERVFGFGEFAEPEPAGQVFVEPRVALADYINTDISAIGGEHGRAYAAYAEAAATAECLLAPELLAGVGFVETVHGTFGGSSINGFGNAAPRITGPALDGDGFALIEDTDRGLVDGDDRFDRAVGPMQFIPTSWELYGEGNPNNIGDASRAAANHLCSSGGGAGADLYTNQDDMRRALRGYNNSEQYFWDVMRAATYYSEIGIFDGQQ